MKVRVETILRVMDVLEIVITVAIALGLCACVYFAFYFSVILMEG